MPRKIRQLKADLRKAGFVEQRDRGKGSHSRWVSPSSPDVVVTIAGHDGDDAKAYQERDVRNAISRVQQDGAEKAVMDMEQNIQWIDVTRADADAALRYALVIEWSDEDDAFVVSVPDFPGLHTHGSTREEAAAMGNEAIALHIAGTRATGIEPPAPRFSALRAENRRLDDADRVRAIRKRLNVSQHDFAEMLNVSVGTVRSWEQGTRTPDGASRRLLDISERAPEVLLGSEQSPMRRHG